MHVVDFCVLGQSVILEVWQSTRRCWVVLVWVEKNPAYVDLKFRRIEGACPCIRCVALVKVAQAEPSLVKEP